MKAVNSSRTKKKNHKVIIPEPVIPKIVQSKEFIRNHRYFLDNDKRLRFIKNLFSKRNRRNSTISTENIANYLISDSMFEYVHNTVVWKLVSNFARNLQSSKKIFIPKCHFPEKIRKPKCLDDIFVKNKDVANIVNQFLKRIGFHELVGEINSNNTANWISLLLNPTNNTLNNRFPDFIYSKSALSKSFRAKDCEKLIKEKGVEKNYIQRNIICNIVAVVILITLTRLRCFIRSMGSLKGTISYCWILAKHRFLNPEVDNFKRSYKTIQLKKPLSNLYAIPTVKCIIVRHKIRHVLMSGNLDKQWLYKILNSVLNFVFHVKKIPRINYMASLSKLRSFLKKIPRRREFDGLKATLVSADIKDCFGSIDRFLLMRILDEYIPDSTYHIRARICRTFSNVKVYSFGAGFSKAEAIYWSRKKYSRMKCRGACDFKISKSFIIDEIQKSMRLLFRYGEGVSISQSALFAGHRLSSSLSHLYLVDFERKTWKFLNESVWFARYEDDYLFCSFNDEMLKRALAPLLTGNNRYNLKMNKDKFKNYETNNCFKWCGVVITDVYHVDCLKK